MILRVFTRSTYIQVPGVSCTGCLQKLILPRVEKIYVKNFISLQFSIMSINILIGWVPGKHVTKHLLYIFRLLTEICPVQVHLPSMDLNNPIYFRRQYTCTCNKNNRSFSPHSRICQSLWDVTIDGEGLQMFIMALCSEGSWACYTYCDMGHPFIMIISGDPWNTHLLPSVWHSSFHYLSLRLRSIFASPLPVRNLWKYRNIDWNHICRKCQGIIISSYFSQNWIF